MTVLKGHCHHQKQQHWGKKSGFSARPTLSINEADLCRDVSDFSRKIRCILCFRNENQKNASETPEFNMKSTQNLPKGVLLLNSF